MEIPSSPPEGFEQVVEGQAAVLFPAATARDVFYNKAQVVNRDLSILILRVFGQLIAADPQTTKMQRRELVILEALAASGLRSLRFWKEIPGVAKILVNDYSEDAVRAIRRNCEYNGVPVVTAECDGKGLVPNQDDAVTLMHRYRAGGGGGKPANRPNVIDLDPYGTAVPFLDSAVQAVDEGGMLLVTCTDASVLCGSYPESCYAKYGVITCKAKYCHEMAVRIVLGHIEKVANKYSRYIVPLVSLSIDFYIRVVVRVFTSKNEVKHALTKLSHLFQCCECSSFHLVPIGKVSPAKRNQKRKSDDAAAPPAAAAGAPAPAPAPEGPPTLEEVCASAGPGRSESRGMRFGTSKSTVPPQCEVCGGRFWLAGPIYGAPIHCRPYVRYMLAHLTEHQAEFKAFDRIRGLLMLAADELPATPLYYHLPTLSANVKTQTPPIVKIRSALRALGYAVSQSHCDPDALKTTADNVAMYDIMKCWQKEQEKDGAVFGTSPLAKNILSKAPTLQADFTYRPECDYSTRATGIAKFPHNEPYWGPMARAKPVPEASEAEGKEGQPKAKKAKGEGQKQEEEGGAL